VTIKHDLCLIRHLGAPSPFKKRDSEEDGKLTAF